MKSFIAAACLACTVTASAFGQELLFNGNVDQTYAQIVVDNAPAGPGAEDFYLPKPLGWINTASRAISGPTEDDLSSEPWAGPAPTPVTNDGNGLPWPQGPGGPDAGIFFKPFAGNSFDGAITAHVYQDVAVTPGTQYQLTGWAGAEANALMAGAEIALEFLDAGNNLIAGRGQIVNLLPTLTVDNGQPFDYKLYTAIADAPPSAAFARARVSMIDASSNPLGGGQAFVVDDFSLTAVPEPATLGLLAFTATGLLRRRGRREIRSTKHETRINDEIRMTRNE